VVPVSDLGDRIIGYLAAFGLLVAAIETIWRLL